MKPIAEIAVDEMGEWIASEMKRRQDHLSRDEVFEKADNLQEKYQLDESSVRDVIGIGVSAVIYEAKSQGRTFYRELKCDPKTPNS